MRIPKRCAVAVAPFVAVGAIMAAPALASAQEAVWTVGGAPVAAATPVTSAGGPAVLATEGGNAITCETVSDTGELLPKGADTDTITFSKCVAKGPIAACEVAATIVTKPLGTQLAFGPNEEILNAFFPLPVGNKVFTTISTKNCGNLAVEGTEPLLGLVEGDEVIVNAPIGSLTVNEEGAGFSTTTTQSSEAGEVGAEIVG